MSNVERAARLLGGLAERDAPIGRLMTTYRVGGNAALFVRVRSFDDLKEVSAVLAEIDLPVLVLGRGSNVLVADSGFPGLALAIDGFADEIAVPDLDDATRTDRSGEEMLVSLGSAVALPVAARRLVAAGLEGFEWAVGVPGTVGGAVRMNAGGHGSDMASSLVSAHLFHLRRGIERDVPVADLGLRFRGSALADHHVVLAATLSMRVSSDREACEERLLEIVSWRREHQPGGQNAGSVFVNPIPNEVSAGELVDGLGLRGLRFGSAEVSSKHANFIQADRGGSADDVLRLMIEVRRRVERATGHALRSEIRLVGEFGLDGRDREEIDAMNGGDEHTVARVRLEAAFDRGHPDPTIPVAALEAERLRDDEVPAAALAELEEVFSGETTAETPRPPDATVPVADTAPGEETPSRVVIVDEDLRRTGDVDFPADAQAGTVNVAPTSTRVVIDDLERDEGSADETEDLSRPKGIRARLARRRTNRPHRGSGRGSRRRRIVAAVGTVLALVITAMVVLASPIVAVSRVDVEGARYADEALIERVVSSLKGESVLTVDTSAAQARLEGDPWIESARVSAFLPNRVLIEIEERVPIAWFVGVDNRARVLDAQGIVLAVLDGRPTEYLLVEGVGPNLVAGAQAPEAYRAAAQLAGSLPPELEPIVQSVGVSGEFRVLMYLVTGTEIDFGEPVDVRNKLVNVLVLLRRQSPNDIVRIDVSGGTPVVTTR